MTIRNHATTNRPSVTLSGLLVARTAQAAARTGAGELSFLQYRLSVDQHVLDADRRLMRLLERSAVDDRRWIEDGDVRKHARTHQATIGEAHALRRERRHLAHGELERKELLVARIVAKDPREGTVGARVRGLRAQRSVRRDAAEI